MDAIKCSNITFLQVKQVSNAERQNVIDSMAYLHFNYLLSNYFKGPVYEVGSVLLLGQLPLDKSYQV